MHIWRLYLNGRGFEGEVIIRAEKEEQAREIASNVYKTAAKRKSTSFPWENSEITKCEILQNSQYTVEAYPSLLSISDKNKEESFRQ